MKTDYPELEGKKIVFEWQSEQVPARVVGCNYHLGITVMRQEGFQSEEGPGRDASAAACAFS